jgi:hypothetical protein
MWVTKLRVSTSKIDFYLYKGSSYLAAKTTAIKFARANCKDIDILKSPDNTISMTGKIENSLVLLHIEVSKEEE